MRLTKHVLIATTMILIAATQAAAGPDLKAATDLCKRASDRASVIGACSTVIDLSRVPKLLERAYNRRGMAEEQLGQFDLAATDYSNVIRLNSSIAGYFDNRMRAYKGAGRLDLALSDANTAVAMAPGYAFALHGRGAVYFDRADYRAAVRDFTAALAINGDDASIHVDRGRALVRLGEIDSGLRDFEAARVIDPANEPALRERGIAYGRLGRTVEARSDLAAAIAVAPFDDEAAKALHDLDTGGGAGGRATVEKNAKPNTAPSTAAEEKFTPSTGAPFCTDKDELQEYLLAALKKDEQWMDQLKTCAFVKGGLKMAIIDAGDPHDGMHIDKVRIFGSRGSMVGYTMNIDR